MLGPIKNVIKIPVQSPLTFAAGFIYGFTSINNLKQLETCYNDDVDSLKLVELAIKAYQSGDKTKAIAYLGSFV